MIIVSQDRNDVVVFNNMKVLGARGNKIAITDNITSGSAFVVGKYKTEERAKEVLQEIISAYRDYRTAECDGYTDILQKTAVYEMPEE